LYLYLTSLAQSYNTSDGTRSKFFTWVRSGQFFVAWVGSAIIGLGLGLENCHLKTLKFSIFFPSGHKKSLQVGSKSTQVEDGLAFYLLWVKSMLGLGRVRSGPISMRYRKISVLYFASFRTAELNFACASRGSFYTWQCQTLLRIIQIINHHTKNARPNFAHILPHPQCVYETQFQPSEPHRPLSVKVMGQSKKI